MKIAMIGQKGIPAQSGGVEQHVDVLARELCERGHEVIVYCRRSYCPDEPGTKVGRGSESAVSSRQSAVGSPESSTADSRLPAAGCPSPHALRHAPRRVFRPSVPTKHLDAITHTITSTIDVLFRDVDLVHYHAIGPAALAPIARLSGLPTVVTCHGLDWQRAKWGGLAKRCLRMGEWLAARWASHLITVSKPLREYFATQYGRLATFIPNGVVPIERRVPARIKQWDLRPGRYLLAASRLVPEKGLHYLIPAFESLGTDLKLVVAGGGGLDPGYEQELHRMAGPRVVFTGNADRQLLGELYSSALLFALPSELEGMSIALLEAMSCGLPVLVSDIPENTCVVEQDGFIFRSRDVAHLREVLASVLENREILPEYGARCRMRSECYQWPRVVTELEKVYHRAVHRHPLDPSGSEALDEEASPFAAVRATAGTLPGLLSQNR